jgi:hypothetical protein
MFRYSVRTTRLCAPFCDMPVLYLALKCLNVRFVLNREKEYFRLSAADTAPSRFFLESFIRLRTQHRRHSDGPLEGESLRCYLRILSWPLKGGVGAASSAPPRQNSSRPVVVAPTVNLKRFRAPPILVVGSLKNQARMS